MKKPQFINNEIYHIYNRGVEKRDIFLDDQDRFRFIHNLFEFNDKTHVVNNSYRFNPKSMEVEPQYFERQEKKPRKLLTLRSLLEFIILLIAILVLGMRLV